MVIEKISIGKFGKFENKTLVFSEGINLIEGENESGKSTVFAFLRFMFYGLSESPSADGLSDRQKYTGMWEGKAFGTLEFSCSKGRFRIERKLGMGGKGAPKEEVAIIDLQLSTPIKGTDPAALFLGVPEEVFLRSCFLDQLCCQPIGSEHLGRAVENMLSSSDESVNALNSAGKLQKELELLEGEDGQIAEKNALLSDLRLRMAKTREQEEEYKRLLQNLKENRKKIENNRKDLAECQREVGYTDALRRVALLKRAGKAAEELQAAQGELENLQKEFGCRSFYPTKAYVKELASYAMDGQMLLTGISEGEERIKALQSEVEALPVFSGGQEELLSSISALEKRRDGLKIKRLAVLGLAGIGAILTVIFLTTKLFLGAGISGAVALICAAVSEVLRRRMRSAEEETDKIYESVGAKNRAEVTSSVARNAAKAAKRETLLGSLEETAAKLKKDRASLEK
ncbi:MAG: AAA family ATPase, partial [Eubacteriales bacterium]